MVPADEDVDERKHLRARLVLDSGQRVLFVDVRRFGTGLVLLGGTTPCTTTSTSASAWSRSARSSPPTPCAPSPPAGARR